jgi:hypothetical protein
VRELEPIWPDAPRYGPDLPFPPYRFVSGRHPHPVRDPEGHSYGQEEEADHVPADAFREDEDYLRGIDLYHAGYLWEAHEAWEGIWKASPDPVQRDFLQGLIQLAASLLKRHVGHERGARGLAEAARERLTRVAAHHPRYMGLDIAALLEKDAPRLELGA